MIRRQHAFTILLGLTAIIVACSGGAVGQDALPIEGFLKAPESDCAALGALQTSFSPSTSSSEAEVYAAKAAHVDSRYVANLAQKLGISAEPTEVSVMPLFAVRLRRSGTYEVPSYVAKDSNGELIVEERTGNMKYYRNNSAASSAGGNMISEDSARETAEQFLQKLGLPLPGELAQVRRQPGGDGINLVWSPQGFRAIDTYTPLGIAIEVGNDGVVEGMDYFWQDLQPIGTYPLASQAGALKRLRGCDGIIAYLGTSPVPVDEARVEYIGFPPSGPFQFFVPVYHFGNDLESLDTPEGGMDRAIAGRATDAWVLAIADDYLKPETPEATPTVSR